ncbi:MAG TPA: LCP family protein [Anaerolineae bacterium]|nr:LCP family protein [Anaerolineae bacterium]
MNQRELERRLEKLFSAPAEPEPVQPSDVISHVENTIDLTPPEGQAPVEPVSATTAPPNVSEQDTSAGNVISRPDIALLQVTLDQIPGPVFVKDRRHRYVFVNSAFCGRVGRNADSLLGQADRDLFSREQADSTERLDDLVFNTGHPRTLEETFNAAGGPPRIQLVHRRPVTGSSGQVDYLVGTIEDITERMRASSALEENERQHRAERKQWEERLRRLKRNLLFQFTFFGLAAGLFIAVFVAARVPDRVVRALTGSAPAQTPILVATESLAVALAGAQPTTAATAAPTALPSLAPTATLDRPAFTPAPTVGARGSVISDTYYAPPAPATLRDFGPNTLNIVLMGSDRRPGDGAWRTDVLILVSIDPDIPSVTLLSFPRDLWVYIPTWRWQRINLADGYGETSGFPGGGPALVKQTIQYNFGIPVHYYARADFAGYKRLVDIVGGVEVVADCPLYDIFPDVPDGQSDIINGEALSTVPTGTIDIPAAGVYHLDGKHALWYARSRKTTSDFDRSRRQQRVLRALWAEIREQGLLARVPELWDTLIQSVETDLTLNDVLYLADVGSRLDPAHIRSRFIDGSMLTWHTTETGANVLLYEYTEIAPVLDEAFAPLPQNITSQAPAVVEVLNGTRFSDWDRVAADRLGWAGFVAPSWGQADSLKPQTQIIDHTTTAKGSRLPALMELFDVGPENVSAQPDPDNPASYQIIVGEDFEPCQRPSSGRWPPAPEPTPTPTATPAP